MAISVGDTLPAATFKHFGPEGPADVEGESLWKGKKIVLFGLPGAYTRTCDAAHVPSFIRTADALRAKGVEEIVCVAVNDPFVMAAWEKSTGAADAGIRFLADPASEFTKALGMEFSVPDLGFFDRCKRFAMVVDDGVVEVLQEDAAGQCEVSTGEAILDTL